MFKIYFGVNQYFFFILCSLLIIVDVPTEAFAQTSSRTVDWQATPNVITETFDQADGLPVISLSDITMGTDGYMYIATSAGVSRFNGSEFELISSEQFPSLRSNRFKKVIAASDSAVWIIDEQNFFSRWKNGKLITFNTLHKNRQQSKWLLKISRSGRAWISNGHTLMVYDRDQGFIPVSDSLGNAVLDFLPLSKSKCLLLTKKGLVTLRDKKRALALPAGDLPFDMEATGLRETKFQEISDHRIVIFNDQRLMLYHTDTRQSRLYSLPDQVITTPLSVIEVNKNTLLLHTYHGHFNINLAHSTIHQFGGTRGKKIGRIRYKASWRGKRLYIVQCSVVWGGQTIWECEDTASGIAGAVQDREGNLWLAVAGKGLVRITLSPFRTLNAGNGLQNSNIYSIIEDRHQNMWLAGYGAGVYRIKNNRLDFWKGGTFQLNNILVRGLYERRDGTLLAATWDGGLSAFDGSNWKPFFLNDSLMLTQAEAFFSDSSGNFWIGSRHGLYKNMAGSENFEMVQTIDDKPLPRVQVIRESPDHVLWFGTHGAGLFVKDKQIRPISFPGLKSELSIRDIFIDDAHTLWIATENYGLIRARFDEDATLMSYDIINQADGLKSAGVHRILEDPHGFFWLSSNHGIFRVNKSRLEQYLHGNVSPVWIRHFTEKDGLPNREANGGVQSSGLVASDSTIWIPTQKGAVHFDPDYFVGRNPYRFTEINISAVTSQDSVYTPYADSLIRLNTGDRSFTIDFDLLHFTHPDNIRLQYRIPEITSGWQQMSSDREINITNMPPGRHHIETRLAGIPSSVQPGASFMINIPYHFYETGWFYGLVTMGILGLIGMAFFSMKRVAKKREQKLNRKVQQRTRSLTRQKNATENALQTIREQAGELERLNRAKTDFFINITHELRTPLALIKGPLGLLKSASNKRGIDREEQLALIERNSDQLNELIDRLLYLMRMETDRTKEELKIIKLDDFARHRFAQFESSKQLKGKRFELHLETNEAFIEADPHAMELIVNNLISNAIKYTHPGDEIVVSVRKDHPHVIFEVADTGIGINEKNLNKVFDPFFRSENASAMKGSGIGLSIVQRFMQHMEGEIEIVSKVNEGTTICLIFPKAAGDEHKMFTESASSPQKNKFANNGYVPAGFDAVQNNAREQSSNPNRAHILIVDDNADVRLFLTRLLENQYKVSSLGKGSEALRLLEQTSFDLIISDVMMPDMDGITLAKHIREKTKQSTIPIILLSAKLTEESITEGLAAGAQVYLTKPVENRILMAQIEALLTREERIKELRSVNKSKHKADFVQRVEALILRHLADQNLNMEAIAEALHMSRSTLYRTWKKHTEQNLNEYIMQMRLEETIRIIQQKNCTFSEASVVCGFSSPAYFTRVFKKYKNCTPTEFFEAQ